MTIKELRNQTGLSQSKFAQKYHIQIGTLQSWEQGVNRTPDTILYLLEQVIHYEDLDCQYERM